VIRAERLYSALLAAHGPQRWWPAQDAFEIVAGALLVQRTTWRNAEIAISSLRQRALLAPRSLAGTELAEIEQCIRGAGFYRTKAARLKQLARFVIAGGGIDGLRTKATPELRAALLALNGIGPETADTILLYAFGRPVVVIDEYLRRLARRISGSECEVEDVAVRRWIEREIGDVARLNELHALVVAHGKASCGTRPRCEQCAIRKVCLTGRLASDA
jgi:endonuclease III related protein